VGRNELVGLKIIVYPFPLYCYS